MEMKTKIKLVVTGVLTALALTGCIGGEKEEVKSESELKIPQSTTFRTVREVEIKLENGISDAMVTLWKGEPLTDTGEELMTIQIDKNGNYSGKITVSEEIKEIYLQSKYMGLQSAKVKIEQGNLKFDYKNPVSAEDEIVTKKTNMLQQG